MTALLWSWFLSARQAEWLAEMGDLIGFAFEKNVFMGKEKPWLDLDFEWRIRQAFYWKFYSLADKSSQTLNVRILKRC